MEKGEQNIIQSLRKRVEQDAQRKSQKIKADNIFNQPTASKSTNQSQNIATNIFANLKKPEQNNLFGGERKSVNLFQMQTKPKFLIENGAHNGQPQLRAENIFNNMQKPAVQNQDSNDDKSEGEQQIQARQRSQHLFKTQPDVKVMKYTYKNQFERILQLPIRKFKNGTELARQQIYVTLQSLPNQPSTLYLIIRTNATKVLVYQSLMMKNISIMQHFMGKPDNLKFTVLKKNNTINQQQPEQPSPQNKIRRQLVKLQFLSEQNCEEFKNKVKNYFENAAK